VRARPLLTAAWPELAGAGEGDAAPIGARGQALAAASAPGGLSDLGNSSGSSDDPPAPALAILRARSLEEEAQAIARQVLEWRAAGIASIGLVALDRLTARRVRALLERAGVNVRDETGWKLSTTSAAAAVMRWFDLVAEGGYWRDLLDWLKSPFSLHGLEGKAAAVSAIERAIRLEGVIAGASAARRALSYECERVPPERETDGEESQSRARARDLLGLIEGEIARTQRAAPNFRAQIGALAEALDALGLRAGLQADPVGRAVLREIAALEAELAPLAGRIAHDDFRALLAQRFEEAAYVDEADGASMTSIVMISLQASLTRPFAAAVLIGADAAHLPALPESAFFLNDALRAELGLRSFDTERARQGRCLAALLCTAPRVTASWRESVDEPNALSPWLERLRFVARCCGADPVTEASAALAAAGFTVDAAPVARPAPRAAALLRDTVSVSQAQSLVDCGYQFYARHLLRLARLDDVVESPDQRDFGELIHAVLNRFHSALGPVDFGACDANELARSLRAEARAVFEPRLRHTPGVLELARRFDGLVAG
jgi:ATP-dependent helicase/nuclease subunit B